MIINGDSTPSFAKNLQILTLQRFWGPQDSHTRLHRSKKMFSDYRVRRIFREFVELAIFLTDFDEMSSKMHEVEIIKVLKEVQKRFDIEFKSIQIS